jgi:hypothetical protein
MMRRQQSHREGRRALVQRERSRTVRGRGRSEHRLRLRMKRRKDGNDVARRGRERQEKRGWQY